MNRTALATLVAVLAVVAAVSAGSDDQCPLITAEMVAAAGSTRGADFEKLELSDSDCGCTCNSMDHTNCGVCTKCGCDWCESTKKCHNKRNFLAQCGSPWMHELDECNMKPINGPPIIIIPGVGGSQLWADCFQARDSRLIWARLSALGDHTKETMMGEYDESIGRYIGFNERKGLYKIFVPKTAAGLEAIDTLNGEAASLADPINYYRTMAEYLQAGGYKPNENMFGFGYDWRQSNSDKQHMRELADLVKSVCKKQNRKVAILAHSMGNLVTKSFMSLYADLAKECIDRWVAMGAPWQGAPAPVIQGLVQGYNFNIPSIVMTNEEAHRLEVGVVSILEMSPNPAHPWQKPPTMTVTKKLKSGENKEFAIEVKDMMRMFKEVNKDHKQELDGVNIDMPLKDAQIKRADQTRANWNTGLPAGVTLHNIYGDSVDTWHNMVWEKVISEPADLMMETFTTELSEQVKGDGTVCAESGSNPGENWPAKTQDTVKTDHSGMLKDPVMLNLIVKYLEENPAMAEMGVDHDRVEAAYAHGVAAHTQFETEIANAGLGPAVNTKTVWMWLLECPIGTPLLVACAAVMVAAIALAVVLVIRVRKNTSSGCSPLPLEGGMYANLG